ncbi:MAG: GNAT family N-acetyltransferase [Planctomycetes bacterium]|nr:GNAT family N-acetyltransferase [Planctomycetota bacterium]
MIYNCTNKSVIENIILHPDVVNWLTDDNSKHYDVVIHPQIYYLVNKDNSGVVRVDPMNSITCSVHIATLPELWGSGHEFVQEALEWGFKNTRYQKVVGFIPAHNERVIKLVNDFNFKQEGVLKKSFLKNWVLVDQLIFSLNKGDF